MIQPKTLIFIGAHPDDESFGMGATLARYAASGVKVYYVCATRGEAGAADPEYMKGYSSPAEMRTAELKAAAEVLGLSGVVHLGYRDSGMPGTPDNRNPESLMMAPEDQVIERIVRVIRDLKPEVVVTHDPSGGYQHPDHIAVHEYTVKAFYASGDPGQYRLPVRPLHPGNCISASGEPRHEVHVKLMPLFGQDPHKFGRNKDIDLTRIVETKYPVHAVIRLPRKAMEPAGGGSLSRESGWRHPPGRGGYVRNLYLDHGAGQRRLGHRDYFMRAYPSPDTGIVRQTFSKVCSSLIRLCPYVYFMIATSYIRKYKENTEGKIIALV
jgi:N-acetyl-1-D-myo-inositol-2-amino-2-deoxy-alpha-D-glucopyranoside deacetylase/mycothiol S-conjugate amidase